MDYYPFVATVVELKAGRFPFPFGLKGKNPDFKAADKRKHVPRFPKVEQICSFERKKPVTSYYS